MFLFTSMMDMLGQMIVPWILFWQVQFISLEWFMLSTIWLQVIGLLSAT